jgi:hypothetical protein
MPWCCVGVAVDGGEADTMDTGMDRDTDSELGEQRPLGIIIRFHWKLRLI